MVKFANLPQGVRMALAQLRSNLRGAIARPQLQPTLLVIRAGGTIGMNTNRKEGGIR